MVVLLHHEGAREAHARGNLHVVVGQVLAVATSTVGLDKERLGEVVGADLLEHVVFDALGIAKVLFGKFAVVALDAGVEAHGSQRLVGVLAGGDGLGVANGNLAVQIRDVGDGLDLGVGALGANDHEVVDEHILTGVGVDELGGLSVIHGTLGSGDKHVDRGTGLHLLDEVAGSFKLRVGKRGASLVGVELLDLGQGLLEGVSSEDLQLDSLLGRCLSRTGNGSGRLGRLVARAAGKAKAGGSGSRKRDKTAA